MEMDDDLREMIAGFVEDSREGFESMEEDLMAMEENPDDPAIMNNLFRVMHTIKGTAGFMGLNDIQTLAHKLESVFDLVRQNKMALSPKLIDFLLPAIDALKAMVFGQVGECDIPTVDREIKTLERIVETQSDGVLTGEDVIDETAEKKVEEEINFDDIMAQFGQNVPVPGQTDATPEAEQKPEPTPEPVAAAEPEAPQAEEPAAQDEGEKIIPDDVRDNVSTELLGQFVTEAEEHLETIEESLLALEEDSSNTEMISAFFRAIHSIKGTAAYVNLKPIETLGHRVESVFDNIRKGTLAYTKEIGDIVFKSIDLLRTMVFYVKIEDYDQIVNITDHVKLLGLIASGEKTAAPQEAPVQEDKESPEDKLATFMTGANQQREILVMFGDELRKGPLDEHSMITLHRGLKTLSTGAGYSNLPQMKKAVEEYEEVLLKVLGGEAEQSKFYIMDVMLPLNDRVVDYINKLKAGEPLPEPKKIADKPAKSEEIKPQPKPEPEPQPKAVKPKKSESSQETAQTQEHTNMPVPAGEIQHSAAHIAKERAARRMIGNDPVGSKEEQKTASSEAKTMRVDASRLDRFMNLIGELIIARNSFKHLADSMDGTKSINDLIQDIKQIENNISRISDNLQDNLMEMRLVQVKTVFQRMPRIVRDIARKTNKKIALQMIGENTEVDKSIVEEIGDPLVHIIRNSCDHGVETPERRQELGKPEQGTIVLKAGHMGSFIAIDVIDDGKGVNPEVVKRLAVKKGVITHDEAEKMTDEQAVNLIFAPGFSTAETVSDVSGRGVGMDVVMTNIRNIQGVVEVTSKVNQGTTVRLKLPLTLAVIEALIVAVGDSRFAIPLEAIKETVQINPEDIKSLKERSALELRGEILGVTPLTELLELESQTVVDSELDEEDDDDDDNMRGDENKMAIVVLQLNNREIGIAVDRLYNQQEIVVKPLEDYLASIPGLKGSTIMGDGQVVLILEPNELMELATSE